jgi:prepilin-type N-terminal cleavage/methylation domain-containing protein
MKKLNSGFTLIELLLVIAIISLLTSIIFPNLNDAREKARIASGKNFSATLKNALGVDLVGEWTFDNDIGTTVVDTSGHNRNATRTGGSYDSNSILDGGYSFNGIVNGEGIAVDAPGDVEIVDALIAAQALTIEFWFYPTSYPDSRENIVGLGGSAIYISSGKLSSWIMGINNTYGDSFRVSNNPPINTWTHVALTWDSNTGITNFYQNGVLTDSIVLPGTTYKQLLGAMGTPNNKVLIMRSSSPATLPGPPGSIDNVRIYTRSLTQASIKNHYLATVHKYFE